MLRRLCVALLAAGTLTGVALVALAVPAGAVTVSTEAELKAAFAAETHIDVQADIVLTDCTGGGGAVERAAAVTDPVTVDGHSHTITQTCDDNVFVQDGSGLFTAQNLVITGGDASGSGGGIFAAGALTVNNSTIAFNRARGSGGGVASDGTATIVNSTINSNSSGGEGGGISIGPASDALTLTNSTVSNNVGGGIGTPPDPKDSVTVVNSTITRNTNGPGSRGSGVFSGGSTTLVYATIVDNVAAAFNNLATTNLESFGSVITGAGTSGNCLITATTSHGYNFSDDDTCGFTDPTDREDAGDPQLGALALNGGPTPTLLPQPGSPLIDAIPVSSCRANGAAEVTTDQRGVSRPQRTGCDIGAVEVEPVLPPTPPTPAFVATPVPATPRFTG